MNRIKKIILCLISVLSLTGCNPMDIFYGRDYEFPEGQTTYVVDKYQEVEYFTKHTWIIRSEEKIELDDVCFVLDYRFYIGGLTSKNLTLVNTNMTHSSRSYDIIDSDFPDKKIYWSWPTKNVDFSKRFILAGITFKRVK